MGAGVAAGLANVLMGDVQNSMTASGTTQDDAQNIGAAISRFTTVASGSGAILPAGAIGDECLVINAGANALSLYPPVGHAINAGATDAAFSVGSTGSVIVKRVSNLLWIAQDASQLPFIQSGSGAVSESVQEALRNGFVSVMSFIPLSERAAIRAGTSTTNVVTYVQAAIDALETAGGGTLFFPRGLYLCAAQLTVDDSKYITLQGTGFGSQVKKGFNGDIISLGARSVIRNLYLEGDGANFTGRGVVISTGGVAVSNARFIIDSFILNTASYGVEFTAAQAGYGTVVHNSQIVPTTQSVVAIKFTVTGETNGNRKLSMV